jgi:FixJ family two-component response regulator
MTKQPSDLIAVLDPVAFTRARTRRLLSELGLASVGFDRSAALSAALAFGRRFATLVLAFEDSVTTSRAELAHLVECAGPEVPIMLLISHGQVELAACAMGGERNDFLLAPFTEQELRMRLGLMHLRWCRSARVGAAEECPQRFDFSTHGRGDESRPMQL